MERVIATVLRYGEDCWVRRCCMMVPPCLPLALNTKVVLLESIMGSVYLLAIDSNLWDTGYLAGMANLDSKMKIHR